MKTPIIIIGLPRTQDVRLVRQLQCVTAFHAQDVTLVSNADPATICQGEFKYQRFNKNRRPGRGRNVLQFIELLPVANTPTPPEPTLGLCLFALLISRSPTLPRTQSVLHEIVGSMVGNGVAGYQPHPSLH